MQVQLELTPALLQELLRQGLLPSYQDLTADVQQYYTLRESISTMIVNQIPEELYWGILQRLEQKVAVILQTPDQSRLQRQGAFNSPLGKPDLATELELVMRPV